MGNPFLASILFASVMDNSEENVGHSDQSPFKKKKPGLSKNLKKRKEKKERKERKKRKDFLLSMIMKPGRKTWAKYEGKCKACGKNIQKDQEIVGCLAHIPNKWLYYCKCDGECQDEECWREAKLHWVHETCYFAR